ncbi:hypothetical protein ACFQUU_25110 [Herbaspirillum sp. GCM10030257]|uniref:hypothetical protein n=1 Tax=Herbaspirillum sp. GCM10030257 TaxID=3273393 RepID=UPI003614B8E4
MEKQIEVFLKELDTAPLALLLWLSGAAIVMFPKFISDVAVSVWSILAITVTGILAWQLNGFEYPLPLKAKVVMVAAILIFLTMAAVATFLTARNDHAREMQI